MSERDPVRTRPRPRRTLSREGEHPGTEISAAVKSLRRCVGRLPRGAVSVPQANLVIAGTSERLAEPSDEGSPALVCAGVGQSAHRPALPVVVLVEMRPGVAATDRRGAAHEVEVVPPRCVEAARGDAVVPTAA
jgi:hypothetical protein